MRSSILAAVLAGAVGCAGSSGQSKKETVTATAEEVGAAFEGSLKALTASVSSLSRIVESPQADLAKSYQAYAADLATLDGYVARLRSLSTAIQARRDEYLQHWVEKTSTITNPELKARSEQRRADLAKDFQTLAGKGSELRRGFAPLHASLQDLAKYLEADLTAAAVDGLKPELDHIRTMNVEVQKLAGEYKTALQSIRAKLATPQAPPPAPAK